jgi:hypothetical protein
MMPANGSMQSQPNARASGSPINTNDRVRHHMDDRGTHVVVTHFGAVALGLLLKNQCPGRRVQKLWHRLNLFG